MAYIFGFGDSVRGTHFVLLCDNVFNHGGLMFFVYVAIMVTIIIALVMVDRHYD